MTIVNSQEIYRKLSSQIESQFPEFIREEGPNFVAFLKAYFEYLEQTKKAGDANRALYDNADIDRTLDEFVEFFRREFLQSIPKNVIADKRLLVKHIKDFYRTRGSQESYKFLFRILFDEEIDFYYPGENILRASDGRWVKETVVKGTYNGGDPFKMEGKTITGETSGAYGIVQEILKIHVLGIPVYQMKIEAYSGSFSSDEIISDGLGNSVRMLTDKVGIIDAVNITDGGAFHQPGDDLTISGSIGGVASAKIKSTVDTSRITFRIQNGGSGYRIANTTISISNTGPTQYASFQILNLSNTEIISVGQDIIQPLQAVTINTVPFGAGGANLAISTVYSVLQDALRFSNITTGSINTIAITSLGKNYSTLPSVIVEDQGISILGISDSVRGGIKGRNAVIVPERVGGTISEITINTSDSNFIKNDYLNITNLDRSTGNTTDIYSDAISGQNRGSIRTSLVIANGTPLLIGVRTLPGRYIDTKGFLSWNNRLQDNDYWQEFSYVIKANKLVDDYRKVVKSTVHPAGTKMFGSYESSNYIDLSDFVIDSAVNRSINVSILEYITLRDRPRFFDNFNTSIAEAMTLTGTFDVSAMFVRDLSQFDTSIDVVDNLTVQTFRQYGYIDNIYVRVIVANNQIANHSSNPISNYQAIPIETYDNTARLVSNSYGISKFANGILKATTGSISVLSGGGSNVILQTVGGSANNTVYQVNAIFSNTAFTLRSSFTPLTSNAILRYRVV